MSNDYDTSGVDWWADRFGRRPVRTIAQLLAGLIAIGLVVWGGLIITHTVAAPWVGKAQAYQQQQSADNFIAAQATFVGENQSFQSALQAITSAQQQLDSDTATALAHPADGIAAYQQQQTLQGEQVAVAGAVNHCQTVAARYDTEAGSYLSRDFRDANLPDMLDGARCQAAANDQRRADLSTATPTPTH